MNRSSRLMRLALAVALVATAAPRVAGAQPRSMMAAIGASVDVLYPPLTATGIHALDFGMILPGTTAVTIQPRTAPGGEFRILGTRTRKSVDISFTLPASLIGPGTATIPLTFNGNYAGLCEIDDTGACVAASYFAWNPVTTPSFHDTPTRYSPGRKTYTYNTYAVYIGGQATPAASQRAGHYTGTVNVTIVIN